MLLILVFIFVQFAVVGLAFSFGGRYERYAAVIILIGTIAFQLAQKALTGEVRAAALLAVDVAMFLAAAWLCWRRPAAWTGATVALQASAIPLDTITFFQPGRPSPDVLTGVWWANSVLVYVQLAVLVVAVLRREFGPPYRLSRVTAQAAAAAATAPGATTAGAAEAAGSTQPKRRASR